MCSNSNFFLGQVLIVIHKCPSQSDGSCEHIIACNWDSKALYITARIFSFTSPDSPSFSFSVIPSPFFVASTICCQRGDSSFSILWGTILAYFARNSGVVPTLQKKGFSSKRGSVIVFRSVLRTKNVKSQLNHIDTKVFRELTDKPNNDISVANNHDSL